MRGPAVAYQRRSQLDRKLPSLNMKTSSNWCVFRVTGPLCGEFTDEKSHLCGLWCYFDVGQHKLWNKQSNARWIKITWRSCDVIVMMQPFVQWHRQQYRGHWMRNMCKYGLRLQCVIVGKMLQKHLESLHHINDHVVKNRPDIEITYDSPPWARYIYSVDYGGNRFCTRW